MNALSLAHSSAQKQSSWNDDPFELGTRFKKDFRVSKEQLLDNYAEELVATYAKYDGESYNLLFSSLHDDEKSELARLYMDTTDRETGECVHGNCIAIDNAYTCALFDMLQNDCLETRENFAIITRKNIILYYTSVLQELINTACDSYMHNINNENGYYASRDLDSGEIVWGKF